MQPGNFYHVYNHANGREDIFIEERNYFFFLQLITKHVTPIAKLFAYSLMPNHFHLLVQLRTEEALALQFEQQLKIKQALSQQSVPAIQQYEFLTKKANKAFSNLLNSYTQSFNKVYNRKGSLFMQNTKQQEVSDDNSLCKVVHYLHANPVHHRFVKRLDSWPHTSYKIFLSTLPTKLERDYVLNVFGGLDQFIKYHEQPIDLKYTSFE